MELHLEYPKSGDPLHFYRDTRILWCRENYRGLTDNEFYGATQWMKWMDALNVDELGSPPAYN